MERIFLGALYQSSIQACTPHWHDPTKLGPWKSTRGQLTAASLPCLCGLCSLWDCVPEIWLLLGEEQDK